MILWAIPIQERDRIREGDACLESLANVGSVGNGIIRFGVGVGRVGRLIDNYFKCCVGRATPFASVSQSHNSLLSGCISHSSAGQTANNYAIQIPRHSDSLGVSEVPKRRKRDRVQIQSRLGAGLVAEIGANYKIALAKLPALEALRNRDDRVTFSCNVTNQH